MKASKIAEDVEKDSALKQKLLQAKKDIAKGNYYTSKKNARNDSQWTTIKWNLSGY